ncbi:MAG TPA: hypothetical protein VF162_02045 [Streptosporangiaceae bacterium]
MSTSTAARPTAASPTPGTKRRGPSRSVFPARSDRRSMSATTTAVAASAAADGSHILARNSPPVRCRCPSTIRFVRFEPGSSSEPALDSSRQP